MTTCWNQLGWSRKHSKTSISSSSMAPRLCLSSGRTLWPRTTLFDRAPRDCRVAPCRGSLNAEQKGLFSTCQAYFKGKNDEKTLDFHGFSEPSRLPVKLWCPAKHPPSNYHQVLGRSRDLAMGVGLGCIASQGKPWKTPWYPTGPIWSMIDGSIMKMDHGPLFFGPWSWIYHLPSGNLT